MSELGGPPSGLSPEQVESLITLNRAHGVFELLRGIAHDLRNNLQIVALGTADDGSNPRLDRAIDAMIDSLDLLGKLGRHPEPDPPETILAAAVREAVDLIDFQRNLPPVRINLELADVTTTVPVAHSALLQILLNLISNAKEACSKSSYIVRVGTTEPLHGQVSVVVQDTGLGVPAGAGRPLVTTRTPLSHGGLGLFVARTLAARFGGELICEATNVRVVFPIVTSQRGTAKAERGGAEDK